MYNTISETSSHIKNFKIDWSDLVYGSKSAAVKVGVNRHFKAIGSLHSVDAFYTLQVDIPHALLLSRIPRPRCRPDMLASRTGLGLKAVQYHFLKVLVLTLVVLVLPWSWMTEFRQQYRRGIAFMLQMMMMMMMKLPILQCAEKLELVLSTAPKT